MYEPQSPDTSIEADRLMFDLLRRMTPGEKLRRIGELGALANAFAEAGIRARHPGATDHEVKMRIAAQSIDRETMIKAFGWDPVEKGS